MKDYIWKGMETPNPVHQQAAGQEWELHPKGFTEIPSVQYRVHLPGDVWANIFVKYHNPIRWDIYHEDDQYEEDGDSIAKGDFEGVSFEEAALHVLGVYREWFEVVGEMKSLEGLITKDALEGDGYGSVSRMDGEVVEMAKVIGLYTITVSLEDGSVHIYHNGGFGESEMTFWNVPTVEKLHLLIDMLGVGDA